jgi:tetratricopeptide (TPR) repeat protein
LPLIQVLWVNTHGLFVLGPIVLGCYAVDGCARARSDSRRTAEGIKFESRPLWRHLAPASMAVALACLVNPYGVRGALFPLELFPKISDPANPYKSYVDEFTSLRSFVLDQMRAAPGTHFHIRIHVLLLLLLPCSFLLPAAWRTWRSSFGQSAQVGTARAVWWATGIALACWLVLAAVLGLPLPGTPTWLLRTGRAVPAVMAIVGAGAALVLAVRSRLASATMAVGTMAVAAWTAWLSAYLFDAGSTPHRLSTGALACAGAGLGALAAALVLRAGGSLFRLLLAAAFTYLSFLAVRNTNLFGLVAGAVLAWNIGEWVAKLPAGRTHRIAAWAARGLVAGLVVLWSIAVVTDRYYALVGDYIHFGLRERPWTFAHDAARFAGRPGLPDRALAFDLGQTGVYVYHNGPERKSFMDARLEVPSLSTFQTYVRIEEWLKWNDARWEAAVNRLGNPLILIGHNGWLEGEATVLTHPRWRCVHFDAVASVFVARQGPSSAPDYPDFDFPALHFAREATVSTPVEPRRAVAEAVVLHRLASVVRKRGGDPWRLRIPILIRAQDLTRRVLTGGVANSALWRLLGLIEWEMVPDLTRPPPGPTEPWDPATGLSWARATYCFRRALEAAPADAPTLHALAECFGVRRMAEARREVQAVAARSNRTEEADGRLWEHAEPTTDSTWPSADRIAVTCMHLGDPDAARRVWSKATDSPSPALRLTRLAEADLASLDAAAAEVLCRQALELDPLLGEAWYVLAKAIFESGRAEQALAACRQGLEHDLTSAQRKTVTAISALLTRRR